MELSVSQKQRFAQDGFLQLPGAVPPELVDAARAEPFDPVTLELGRATGAEMEHHLEGSEVVAVAGERQRAGRPDPVGGAGDERSAPLLRQTEPSDSSASISV